MKKQTYRALMAVIKALTDNPQDIEKLKAYGDMSMQIVEATFNYAEELAE